MFETILDHLAQPPDRIDWSAAGPGVRICDFHCRFPEERKPALPPGHYEILLCREGALAIGRAQGGPIHLTRNGILLLSDVSQIQSVRCLEGVLRGVLVTVDGAGLQKDCASTGGLNEEIGRAVQYMADCRGCDCIGADVWSEALFTALDGLPREARGRYCALKAVELLYLLGRGCFAPQKAAPRYFDQYQTETMHRVGGYIRGNLDGDLSIRALAERFRLSSTGLKTCFRQIYGMPVHQYVSLCRMEQAARLLDGGTLPVVQIAAEVGYSSASQFGAVFKKRYHCSPVQYRRREKMSETDSACPNQMFLGREL